MSRFYKFLFALFVGILFFSFIYAVLIQFALFEMLRLMPRQGFVLYFVSPTEFIGPGLVSAIFLSFAQIFIIAMLLKKSIERGKGFTIKNILVVTVLFFMVTTLVLFAQALLHVWIYGNTLLGLLNAFGSIQEIGWVTFPLGWTFLYLYLLMKYKLGGPPPSDPFEFENK